MTQKTDHMLNQIALLIAASFSSQTVLEPDSTISTPASETTVSEKPDFTLEKSEKSDLIPEKPETPSVPNVWNGTNPKVMVAASISPTVQPKTPNANPMIKISDPPPRPKVINKNTYVTTVTLIEHVPCYVAGAEPKPLC
jgi:hypothetical protein